MIAGKVSDMVVRLSSGTRRLAEQRTARARRGPGRAGNLAVAEHSFVRPQTHANDSRSLVRLPLVFLLALTVFAHYGAVFTFQS